VPRSQVIFADEGYAGTSPGMVWRLYGWAFQLVRRLEPGLLSRDRDNDGRII